MGPEQNDQRPRSPILDCLPLPVADIAVALSGEAGSPVETIAVCALTVAGAALGRACRTTADGVVEETPALQFALLGLSPENPLWLDTLVAPLREQQLIGEKLSSGPPEDLPNNLRELKARYWRLKENPSISDSVRRMLMDELNSFTLAAKGEPLLTGHVHPSWPDHALSQSSSPPLWACTQIGSENVLAQWAQLCSAERRWLNRALHGGRTNPLHLNEAQSRCPTLLSTTPDQAAYWFRPRGPELPLLFLPTRVGFRSPEQAVSKAMTRWRGWLKLLLGIRTLTKPVLLSCSIVRPSPLSDFDDQVERVKKELPRRLRARLDPLKAVCRQLACLLHVLNSGTGDRVSGETEEAAARMGKWILSRHAEALVTVESFSGRAPVVPPIIGPTEGELLMRKISASPDPLSRRQLLRKLPNLRVAQLDVLLAELHAKKQLVRRR